MDLNKLKEIQAVVFDMDGLMFDSERYVQKSWDIAGERLGYGPLGHNIVNTLGTNPVSYTHLRAHETDSYLVCRLLLEKKKKTSTHLRAP